MRPGAAAAARPCCAVLEAALRAPRVPPRRARARCTAAEPPARPEPPTQTPAQAPTQRTRGAAVSTADRHAVAREEAFSELALGADGHYDAAGGIRTRQHANPLLSRYQTVPEPPDWGTLYEDPTRPLVLDVGCGPGRFALLCAQRTQSAPLARFAPAGTNFLGLEIREKLVERAGKWADQLGHADRCAFLPHNATVSTRALLSSYPGPLALACVQFPDPHFKRRHHKRRVVQAELVEAIVEKLEDGGAVWLQSDVEAVEIDMLVRFIAHARGRLVRAPEALAHNLATEGVDSLGADRWGAVEAEYEDELETEAHALVRSWPWMTVNPLEAPTEREVLVQAEGQPVFRMLLEKTAA